MPIDEQVTGLTEVLTTATRLTGRQCRLIQGCAIRRMERRGLISRKQADKLRAMNWQEFIEWVLEYGPQIMEFILMIIAALAAIGG